MGEVRFMISEAAKQVHVESHVLRYWEEELELVIGRTEMGHRYYTEDDIQLLKKKRPPRLFQLLLRFALRRLCQLQQPSPKQKSCRSLNWNRSVL